MTTELKIPEVGESVSEALIVEWLKDEGDQVEVDEDVVVIETDKANLEVPSPITGRIKEILKKKDEWVSVGDVIAYIDEGEKGDGKKSKDSAKTNGVTEEEPSEEVGAAEERGGVESDESTQQEEEEKSQPRPLPAARRLLTEHEIDPEEVDGTGKGGRILKEDVLNHIEKAEGGVKEEGEPAESLASEDREEESVPMSPLRRSVARRLVEAQREAALLTTFNEIDLSQVVRLREEHGEAFKERYDVKLGFMSFFVKASVEALKAIPEVNAEVHEKNIVYHNYFDIGIAVSGKKGLLVPVLRNAERMSFAEVERAIRDFADRARRHEISLDELKGGTFTISNGGVFGSLLSTPIVNPPQSAVLGLHAIQERPVVRGGEIVIRPMMFVALTYDHRIIDGREAVMFLRHIKENIEEPSRILLEI